MWLDLFWMIFLRAALSLYFLHVLEHLNAWLHNLMLRAVSNSEE